ncbi:MAG: glycosyltransferase family 39 protein [Candidatus Poribacteria bacterium]|nr:glycosyltransferase family 39 protein [Candidatus Poribacteria bacterium]
MLKFSSQNCLKNKHILLVCIVSIGALLRFWNLGQWSFWIDEVLTVLDAEEFSLSNSPINPIPYIAAKFSVFLSGKLSFIIDGSGEWNSRLIFCIAGIISIPIVFSLGKHLYDGRVGLLAATFVALSNWHLFWSQNARSYIFTFLFAALTAWFFYRSLENDSTLLTICALFFCICLILSHLLAAAIVPALAVYAILQLLEERNRKRWINLLLFFMPFTIPVLMLALPQIRGYISSGWGHNEWGRSPLYIVLTLVQGVSIPIAVTAFFAAIVNPRDRATRFLLCFAGVPLVLLLVASQLQNVAGYYLFWTTPAYFILAAAACTYIWEAIAADKSNLFKVLLPCLIVVVLLSQDYLYFRYENGGRPKWREAFEAIQVGHKPTDILVLSEPEMARYYLPEMETIDIDRLVKDNAAFEKEWKNSGGKRLWFIVDVASFNVFDSDMTVRNWIRERSHLVKTLPSYSRAKDRTMLLYLVE